MSWAQLRHLDVPQSTIHEWAARSYLTRVLPKVYAIGHTAPSREADLWAAVLYAGPGAMLSHATAARWRGLIDYAPRIDRGQHTAQGPVAPGRAVYARRHGLERPIHAGIPVTPVPQMMLDLARDLRPEAASTGRSPNSTTSTGWTSPRSSAPAVPGIRAATTCGKRWPPTTRD